VRAYCRVNEPDIIFVEGGSGYLVPTPRSISPSAMNLSGPSKRRMHASISSHIASREARLRLVVSVPICGSNAQHRSGDVRRHNAASRPDAPCRQERLLSPPRPELSNLGQNWPDDPDLAHPP
jgi:hypothetical protein